MITEQERLAQFLFRRACEQVGLTADWHDEKADVARRTAMENAAAILDSDVIRERDAAKWDEGWREALKALGSAPLPASQDALNPLNPYREAQRAE